MSSVDIEITDPKDERIAFSRGQGRYIDDITPDKCLHAAFVRSPHARAKIRSMTTEAAEAFSGAAGVFTGAFLKGKVNPIIAHQDVVDGQTYQNSPWPVIAHDEVRFAGDIVAACFADDPYTALDMATRVTVDYEVLEPILGIEGALAAGADTVHDGLRDNVLFFTGSEQGDKAAFEAAPVRVKATFEHPRVAAAPIECYGSVMLYDAREDAFEVWAPTQIPHVLRDGLAACLGHPESQIRVRIPDIGGSFGVKMQLHPEEVVLAFAAKHFRRPTKWMQDRREHLTTGFQSRKVRIDAELRATEDGRVVGVRARNYLDIGAYSSFPLTCAIDNTSAFSNLPGQYNFAYYDYEGRSIATNTCPTGAYRGVGNVLGAMVMEGLMDKLALRLNMDRLDVRLLNMVQANAFPHRSPSGSIFDSGNFPALLQDALALADFDTLMARHKASLGDHVRLGVGVACFVEPTGVGCAIYRKRGITHIPGFDSVRIVVNRSGAVEAYSTTPDMGQGHYTSMRRMLAQRLQIPVIKITVRPTDTAATPYGSGTFASRSAATSGSAFKIAGEKLIVRMKQLIAMRLKIEPDLIDYQDGLFSVESSNLTFTFDEVAHFAHSAAPGYSADVQHGLETTASFDVGGVATTSGVHIALVAVDVRTGAVKVLDYVVAEDCGTILNEAAVDGQIRGGVVQGIGAALTEEVRWDQRGRIQSDTFASYRVPRFGDVPQIRIVHRETPSPITALGQKGMAEAGIIGATPALSSAVMHALGADWETFSLPLTPDKVVTLAAQAGVVS